MVAISFGMLVTAPLGRRAARSEVGRLLYSERRPVLNYLIMELAFASSSADALVLTRLGFRQGLSSSAIAAHSRPRRHEPKGEPRDFQLSSP